MRREFFKALPFALTGGFSLFLAFNAGLFVMLALAHFLENAAAGALPLKPFERTFQGLIFADTNLGHCYPSPRSIQWPAEITRYLKTILHYTAKAYLSQDFSKTGQKGRENGGLQLFFKPFCPASENRRVYENGDGELTGRHQDHSLKRHGNRRSDLPALR